jgi:2-polyprenyl-3-methyl-5-hydroxy-6-metoxy-1,4-benzoquinol methylase
MKFIPLLPILSLTMLAPIAAAQSRQSGARWDEIYQGSAVKVPVNPSTLVLETTANLDSGLALDIGMGNGRNAVYLARKGWKVTGIDVSREAIKQAQAAAGQVGANIEANVARFEDIPAYRGRYDLILCMYVSNVATKNATKIMDMLKPGGILIVEGPHLDARTLPGQDGYKTNELLRAFGRLRVLRYEDRTIQAEWATTADGRSPTVRLVAQKVK